MEITLEATFKGPPAEKLLAAAKKRDQRPIDLLADIVTVVVEDDLFAALLDN